MLTIKRIENKILVSSPYSPDLPSKAKQLNGKWDCVSKVWQFPIEIEEEVKALYMDIYGEWDIPQKTVILKCHCNESYSNVCSGLSLAGRSVAYAFGRDSGAKLADGIVVLRGGFTSGGSMKNWQTICKSNTVFKILNVPEQKAKELVQDPDWCEKIEIEETKNINIEKLQAEKELLLKRIAEIDSLLKE